MKRWSLSSTRCGTSSWGRCPASSTTTSRASGRASARRSPIARGTARAKGSGAAPDIEEVVDRLLEDPHSVRDRLSAGTPEERRGIVRNFLADIREEKATRQAIRRWYRLPRDVSLKFGGAEGI